MTADPAAAFPASTAEALQPCRRELFAEDLLHQQQALQQAVRTVLEETLPVLLDAHLLPRLQGLIDKVASAAPSTNEASKVSKEVGKAEEAEKSGHGAEEARSRMQLCEKGALPLPLPQMPKGSVRAWVGKTSQRRSSRSQHSCHGRNLLLLTAENIEEQAAQDQRLCSQALHPDRMLRKNWDRLALCIFVLDVLYSTFEWAFLTGIDGEVAEIPTLVVIFATAICVFWGLDLLLNFLTGYLDSRTCTVELSLRAAALCYLRTWFAVDLLATAQPLASATLQAISRSSDTGVSPDAGRLMALIRLLKTMRLARVVKMAVLRQRLARLDAGSHSMVLIGLLCLGQLLVVLFVTSHVAACGLWFMGKASIRAGDGEASWVTSSDELLQDATLMRQYVSSMFLSLSIMTGVGMGKFSTSSVMEQVIFSFFFLLALMLMGILVNEVAAIYEKMRESGALMRCLLSEASNFMCRYHVPTELQSRVERYLQTVFNHKEQTDFRENLKNWLQASGGLLTELNSAMFARNLEAHPQLRLASADVLALASNLCESAFYPPGEAISRPGRPISSMVYIRCGVMEVLPAWRKDTASSPGATYEGEGRALESHRKLGAGELLFAKNLLLPSFDRGNFTCVSRTFCEVTLLNFASFVEDMEKQCPEVLWELRVHAAIEDDAVEWLAWALSGTGGRGKSRLRLGEEETTLHACARAGAANCIRWLVCAAGALPDLQDSGGRTPLEVAKAAGRKAAVDALVVHGAEITAATLRQGTAQILQRPRWLEELRGASPEPSCKSLSARLERAGIDLAAWGVNNSKSVAELFAEVQSGMSACIEGPDGPVRVLCVARVRIQATCNGHEKLLVETQEERWLGAASAVHLPANRMALGALDEALQNIWSKDLRVSPELIDEYFERGAELIYEEEKVTKTYPGLRCIYVVHEVPYWVRQVEDFGPLRCLGLPAGSSFETTQERGDGKAKRRVFAWVDAPQPPSLEEAASLWQGTFAAAGADLSACGLGQALILKMYQEMRDGMSLPMLDKEGKVVRVVYLLRLHCPGPQLPHGCEVSEPGLLPHGKTLECLLRERRTERGLAQLLASARNQGTEPVSQGTFCLPGRYRAKAVREEVVEWNECPAIRCIHIVQEMVEV